MLNIFRNRKLRELRDAWESPQKQDRDFSSIRTLFELTTPAHGQNLIDDKTWNDLDMNSVFRKIDTTLTSVGQQYLYKKLRLLARPDSSLKDDYHVANLLREDRESREQLQLNLKLVTADDARSVTRMLFGKFPVVNFPRLALAGWTVLSLATIVYALVTGGIYSFLIIPILIANFVLSRYFENATDQITYVLYYLYNLATVSQRIAKQDLKFALPARRELQDNIDSIRQVRRALKLASFSQNHDNILINNLMYLINLVVLYDFFVYSFSIKSILGRMETLRRCYLAIGSIDASIATAGYLQRYSQHSQHSPHTPHTPHAQLCNPEFTDASRLDFEDVYHPLLENYVANSYSTTGPSALITGSNMAGKTTFIKTIGVNYILARTLWLCHASSARLPVIGLLSSIKTEDGLEAGKSFYFSELERLKEFLVITEKGGGCLLLIDEIYRGTNTVERIAGAAAVLQELAGKNLVLVTTHDIELTRYLGNQFDMWYFEETGSTDRPFDYKLRSGVCETRNAIRLMANMGYPEHITERARSIAKDMEAED